MVVLDEVRITDGIAILNWSRKISGMLRKEEKKNSSSTGNLTVYMLGSSY